MTFKELGLIEPILKALETEGYSTPTPIQEQAIPILLNGHDILGCAQTGTGKTAAFALPIIQKHHLEATGKAPVRIKTLILTPTRELAIQIGDSFRAYGVNTPIKHTVIFGGVGQHPQTEALKRGIEVLIATPGRLLDLMNQGFVHLKDLEVFVLDEADRMLDMGFIHDVRKVIAKLPAKRQTLFFSATMPNEIQKLADSILSNPKKVAVTPVSSTAEKVAQSLYFVEKKEKKELLADLLANPDIRSALVFSRTKHGANKIAKELNAVRIGAEAIHGNKSQTARQAALSNFKSGKTRVLVATDIAARGIDIDELAYVINYDLPNIPETYVHRIGRTGRAGASGQAISFCDAEERAYLRDIEKLIGKKVPILPLPDGIKERSKNNVVTADQDDEDERPQRNTRPASEKRGLSPQQKRQIQQFKNPPRERNNDEREQRNSDTRPQRTEQRAPQVQREQRPPQPQRPPQTAGLSRNNDRPQWGEQRNTEQGREQRAPQLQREQRPQNDQRNAQSGRPQGQPPQQKQRDPQGQQRPQGNPQQQKSQQPRGNSSKQPVQASGKSMDWGDLDEFNW